MKGIIYMKKIFAGIIAFAMLFGTAYADDFVISEMVNTVSVSAEELIRDDGLKYTLNDDGTEITITGFKYTVSEIDIPAQINGVPVTAIKKGAFQGYSLDKITIPDSVTVIDDYTFANCTLKSIVIPDTITRIGDNAFRNCSGLTSIKIPDTVTEIGNEAFRNCRGFTSIKIPDSVTSIGTNAFEDCASLTEVTIPDSVSKIGYAVFSRCSALKSVTIPESVTSIGYLAFGSCESLKEITIPESVTDIADKALGYYNYTGLEKYEDFVIKGVKGSAAETYANDNKFEFIEIKKTETEITGDLDSDGEITSSDALNILQLVVSGENLTDEQKKLADMDGDGEITSADALYILQMVVGLR